jgi:hypothetical protein
MLPRPRLTNRQPRRRPLQAAKGALRRSLQPNRRQQMMLRQRKLKSTLVGNNARG